MGRSTIKALAKHDPAHIYFTGRNATQAKSLIEEIKNVTSKTQLTFIECDFQSLNSIKAGMKRFTHASLDIVICNAGISMLASLFFISNNITLTLHYSGQTQRIEQRRIRGSIRSESHSTWSHPQAPTSCTPRSLLKAQFRRPNCDCHLARLCIPTKRRNPIRQPQDCPRFLVCRSMVSLRAIQTRQCHLRKGIGTPIPKHHHRFYTSGRSSNGSSSEHEI